MGNCIRGCGLKKIAGSMSCIGSWATRVQSGEGVTLRSSGMAEPKWRSGDRVTHVRFSAGSYACLSSLSRGVRLLCWSALSREIWLIHWEQPLRVLSFGSRFTVSSCLRVGDSDRISRLVGAA